MTSDPEYLRAADVARLMGISLRTVRRWIADAVLPSVKLKGLRLVARADLQRLLTPPNPAVEEDDGADEISF